METGLLNLHVHRRIVIIISSLDLPLSTEQALGGIDYDLLDFHVDNFIVLTVC